MNTDCEQIASLVQAQRDFFCTGATLPTEFRKTQLKRLYAALAAHEAEITAALFADLKKSALESYETEIALVLAELRYALRHINSWTRPKRVRLSPMHFCSKARIYPEPHGVSLIMSPWNYPFLLTFSPLVSAIAAGNCAVIKPSQHAPHASRVIASLIEDTFDARHVCTVQGGREIDHPLLSQPFDFIFFTGSPAAGKAVAAAAAERLIPICLELGGKSPCIVDGTANIDIAARRIIWGKLLNAGQTCIAPDYVLVCTEVKEPLMQAMQRYIRLFYGSDPVHNAQYPCIINMHHFERLRALADGSDKRNGAVRLDSLHLYDAESRKIAPVLLDNPHADAPVMQEEIFGPVLPVIAVADTHKALRFAAERPAPLALYIFSEDKTVQRSVISQLRCGGCCINDTIMHIASPLLPFGGVGNSGQGRYHGKFGFDTFSHRKSVLKKSTRIDIQLRYPPHTDDKTAAAHLLMR